MAEKDLLNRSISHEAFGLARRHRGGGTLSERSGSCFKDQQRRMAKVRAGRPVGPISESESARNETAARPRHVRANQLRAAATPARITDRNRPAARIESSALTGP